MLLRERIKARMRCSWCCWAVMSAVVPRTPWAAAAPAAAPGVTALTPNTFESATQGKVAFIKFFAPWCQHCQSMHSDWVRLAADWNGQQHNNVLVAEFDCTASATAEHFCSDDLGIQGFPTIMYGDASHHGVYLQTFPGDRDYATLAAFATDLFAQPLCSPANIHGCDDATAQRLRDMNSMSAGQLHAEIAAREAQMQQAEAAFRTGFDAMQQKYNAAAAVLDNTKAAAQYELRILHAIREFKLQGRALA